MKFLLAIVFLSASGSTALSIIRPSTAFLVSKPSTSVGRQTGMPSKLSAIIYGWDGDDDDTSNLSYTAVSSDLNAGQCSAAGVAVAESLSQDGDKIGALARLAVAFSPPERKIAIKDIENINVVCVREDRIELEAILCESHGCVSLMVPVKFPTACEPNALEGCVMMNLKHLDTQAESYIIETEGEQKLSQADLDELCLLSQKIDYPVWWVPPECNAKLAADCDLIRGLLNEDEFMSSVVSLAQDGLDAAGTVGMYTVKKAKVAAVGPAGICFKVAATSPQRNDLSVMDVMYPFGGEPVQDVESLRALVLGAIAEAEDKRPAHIYKNL